MMKRISQRLRRMDQYEKRNPRGRSISISVFPAFALSGVFQPILKCHKTHFSLFAVRLLQTRLLTPFVEVGGINPSRANPCEAALILPAIFLKDVVFLPAFGSFFHGSHFPAAPAFFAVHRQVAVAGRHAAHGKPAPTSLADPHPQLALHTFHH